MVHNKIRKVKKHKISRKAKKNNNNKGVIVNNKNKEVVMTKRNKEAANKKEEDKNPQVKDVSINYVNPKKFTRNSDPKFNMQNTVSCADLAMKVMLTMIFVSSVNKFTQVQETQRMTINGLGVMNAIDG